MTQKARRALSKRVRFEVFKRDSFACQYCGESPPDVILHVDHVVPVREGGSDNMDNLTTSCFACNAGKGGVGLGRSVPPLDEQSYRAAIQEAYERAALVRASIAASSKLMDAQRDAVEYLMGEWMTSGLPMPNATQLRSALGGFVRRGEISVEGIADLIITIANQPTRPNKSADMLRYFCAACWRVIRYGGQE
jgi:hypothetical protein